MIWRMDGSFLTADSVMWELICVSRLPRIAALTRPPEMITVALVKSMLVFIHGLIHPPLNTLQLSCPLCRKAPHTKPMMFPPPWDCTNPSSSSKHGKWSSYQKVIFWSHLTTWPSPMPPLDHQDGLWQTSDRAGHVLAWAGGPCACCRIVIHDGVVCY